MTAAAAQRLAPYECPGCGALWVLPLYRCGRCGWTEKGRQMPKITERGPSDATRPGLVTPPPAPDRHGRAGVGGEQQDQQEEAAGVLWKCTDCSTRYAPGLDACPHCGSQDYVEVAGQDGDATETATGDSEDADAEESPEPDQPAGDALPAHPPRPAASASKGDWVDYACAVDDTLGRDEANSMTKADLVDRYGPRP